MHNIGAADRYAGQLQDVLLERQIGDMVPILAPLFLRVGAFDFEYVPRAGRRAGFKHVAFREKSIGKKRGLEDGFRALGHKTAGFVQRVITGRRDEHPIGK